jgi:hypothetical protein
LRRPGSRPAGLTISGKPESHCHADGGADADADAGADLATADSFAHVAARRRHSSSGE